VRTVRNGSNLAQSVAGTDKTQSAQSAPGNAEQEEF